LEFERYAQRSHWFDENGTICQHFTNPALAFNPQFVFVRMKNCQLGERPRAAPNRILFVVEEKPACRRERMSPLRVSTGRPSYKNRIIGLAQHYRYYLAIAPPLRLVGTL